MTPPTPEPSSWAVANQKTSYGYYAGYVLKLDGVLVNTWGTLTDGDTNTWNLENIDDGMGSRYFTPGFFVNNNIVYLECHVNKDVYRYNGSTWVNQGGTTDPDQVDAIEANSSNLGINSALLAVFVNGSVSL